jgi:hypothetical protein
MTVFIWILSQLYPMHRDPMSQVRPPFDCDSLEPAGNLERKFEDRVNMENFVEFWMIQEIYV